MLGEKNVRPTKRCRGATAISADLQGSADIQVGACCAAARKRSQLRRVSSREFIFLTFPSFSKLSRLSQPLHQVHTGVSSPLAQRHRVACRWSQLSTRITKRSASRALAPRLPPTGA